MPRSGDKALEFGEPVEHEHDLRRFAASISRAISTDILDFRARVLAIQGGTGRLVDSDSDT